jgi:hypothetical protein
VTKPRETGAKITALPTMPKKFRDELFSLTPMRPSRYRNAMVNTTDAQIVACTLKKPPRHPVLVVGKFLILTKRT